jgi:hypothetical protein
MRIERRLRRLQDNLRNAGWRIQHISWQPEGKLEFYNPPSPFTWLLILVGFAAFFGGIPLMADNLVSTPVGIGIMLAGIVLLIASRYTAGYRLYRHYVRVDAKCLDRDVQEFEDPDNAGSLIKNTFWAPRLLCEYRYRGQTYTVTPIIVKTVAFRTESAVHRFLDARIDRNQKCTLWINPEVPLQTFFHKKPFTGPHTA